jgi:Integrase zinc binding domain
LLGSHCNFHCDNKNLGFQYFKSERFRRWRATLEEFDYSFIYCIEKDNTFAVTLSRYPTTSVESSNYEEVTTLQDSSFPATTYNIKKSQDFIPNLQAKLAISIIDSIIERDGINLVCQNKKIIIDFTLFDDILAWYHINLNHAGQDCKYSIIQAVFYLTNMEAKIRQYVSQFQICNNPRFQQKIRPPS